MHVAGAAHRWRIGQALRHLLDNVDHLLPGLALIDVGTDLQRRERQHRAGPGAVMLGGERRRARLAQIRVHGLRIDAVGLAFLVQVLE